MHILRVFCIGCVIGHASNHKWLLHCTCPDEHLLVICSLESFYNDCPCLIKCLIAWYLFFTYLIALCLLFFIPCVQLVISLMKVFFYVRVFQVIGINCKCFTVSRLGVSEFCHCSQTHIIDNEMRNQLQRKKHSDITSTSIN